jgi:peptidoglycan hydrolase-like protein with peptidoglycan-binding domain
MKITSEQFMTNKGDITTQAYADATTNEEKSYLSVNCDIDTVAQAIRDCDGVVLGVSGTNNGTWLTPYPLAQQKEDNTSWHHWLYAGKTRVVNGVKYIGVLNSWGNSVGEQGWQYLSEDFFKNGLVWACWTMIYNQNIKYIFKPTIKIGDRGLPVKMLQIRLGISADGIFGKITKQAVQTFQVINGLVPDGICGKLTCAKLNL